ncbi:hypothetical protein [Sphingomonas sp. G-3-2-10]|nr:hypothetical protein [Sphingomonas sp. G-3-2-10]
MFQFLIGHWFELLPVRAQFALLALAVLLIAGLALLFWVTG